MVYDLVSTEEAAFVRQKLFVTEHIVLRCIVLVQNSQVFVPQIWSNFYQDLKVVLLVYRLAFRCSCDDS